MARLHSAGAFLGDTLGQKGSVIVVTPSTFS